jgi:hypothetical protein
VSVSPLSADLLTPAEAQWAHLSERTRARLVQMDRDANPDGTSEALDRYLSVFSDDIVAHGLVDDGDTGKAGMRGHYAPVFSSFPDLRLVTEELVVAGEMAAQKYHAAGTITEPDGTPIRAFALRGYTFFRFGGHGLVVERWSNHDHEYRLTQLEGPDAAEKGRLLQHRLNGPSLGEEEVFRRLVELERALNVIDDPLARSPAVRACFAPSARVHVAAGGSEVGPDSFLEHLEELWTAVPDLVFHHDARLTAWGYGAVRWRATGYARGSFRGVGPGDSAVVLYGETIVRYDDDGLIDAVWTNDDLVGFADQIRRRAPDKR